MPDKTKPKKSFPYIQIRLEKEIKGEWIKFVKEHSNIRNLTHLITAAVENFMDTFDNPPTVNSNGKDAKEMLKVYMEVNNKKDEQIQELLKGITNIQIAMAKKSEFQDETDLTARVYGLISQGSFNENEIAKFMGKDESLITDICNSFVKKGSIELDPKTKEKMRYKLK